MIPHLAAAVRFLILTQWLTQQVMSGLAERDNSYNLDMAPNAFDDQYKNCIEEMDKEAPLLLKHELKVNKQFKDKWEEAKEKWDKIKNKAYSSKLNDYQGTAVVAYTGDIGKPFNKAVREYGKNPSNFHFRALHYYLTRALQLLSAGECYDVYRGDRMKYHHSGQGKLRFGQFTSSSSSAEEAKKFIKGGTGTFFTIKTCSGINIAMFSFHEHQKEVLISGNEVFKVVSMTKINGTYNEISLQSTQELMSNLNCSNSSGMKESPASMVLLPGLVVLLLLPAEL